MSSSLHTLAKIKKQEIDVLKKRQAILLERKDHLIERSKALAEQLFEEIRLARELAQMGSFFGDFSNHIKKQQHAIVLQVAELDIKINKITDELANIFAEMKKYEIAIDVREAKVKAKKIRKEQAIMDEIAARKIE